MPLALRGQPASPGKAFTAVVRETHLKALSVWLANHKIEFSGLFRAHEYSCKLMNLNSIAAYILYMGLAAFRLLSVSWTRS
jgi:hypothetical protein